jgi:uncharacterized alkaline shock family protein YloU
MGSEYPSGKTTVAPDVILTIARMSALGVPGVHGFAPVISGVDGLFRRGITDGIRVQVENGLVYLDLFLVLNHDVNVREVSRNVQHQVARSTSEMLGMEVGHVNIHIENIAYEQETA